MKEIDLPLVIKYPVTPSNAKKRIPRITAIIQQVVDKAGEPNKKKKKNHKCEKGEVFLKRLALKMQFMSNFRVSLPQACTHVRVNSV